jgi:acyl-CoA synthetase (AMP-forming)/AMP-acid ligase II
MNATHQTTGTTVGVAFSHNNSNSNSNSNSNRRQNNISDGFHAWHATHVRHGVARRIAVAPMNFTTHPTPKQQREKMVRIIDWLTWYRVVGWLVA